MLGQRYWTPYPHETPGLGGSSSSSLAGDSIVWRPGATPNGSIVSTYAQVQNVIDSTQVPLWVYVDALAGSPAIVPPGGPYNCRGITTFASFGQQVPGQGAFMTIKDGATLANALRFDNQINVSMECFSTPALTFNYQPVASRATPLLYTDDFVSLIVNPGALVSPVQVPSGLLFAMYSKTTNLVNTSAVSFVSLATGANVVLFAFEASSFQNFVSGDASTVLHFTHDDMTRWPSGLSSYGGTFDNSTPSQWGTPDGTGPTTSVFVSSGAGANASLSSGSTDWAGHLMFNSGGGPDPVANSPMVKVSFTTPTSGHAHAVVLFPMSSDTLANAAEFFVSFDSTGFTLNSPVASAPAPNKRYEWSYVVVGNTS